MYLHIYNLTHHINYEYLLLYYLQITEKVIINQSYKFRISDKKYTFWNKYQNVVTKYDF